MTERRIFSSTVEPWREVPVQGYTRKDCKIEAAAVKGQLTHNRKSAEGFPSSPPYAAVIES
jgi:hypothetical protein